MQVLASKGEPCKAGFSVREQLLVTVGQQLYLVSTTPAIALKHGKTKHLSINLQNVRVFSLLLFSSVHA